MKCPHCNTEITDYVGRCLSCKFCRESSGYYCGCKPRMEMLKEKYNDWAPNASFSAYYDGSNCKYYEEEE